MKLGREFFSDRNWKDYIEWKKKNKKEQTSKNEKPTKKKKAVKKKKKQVRFTSNTYKKELRDKRWHKVRDIVIERDNKRCVLCGSKNNLQVHHTVYDGRHAWEYPIDTMFTLCGDCHIKVHGDKNHHLHEKYKYDEE